MQLKVIYRLEQEKVHILTKVEMKSKNVKQWKKIKTSLQENKTFQIMWTWSFVLFTDSTLFFKVDLCRGLLRWLSFSRQRRRTWRRCERLCSDQSNEYGAWFSLCPPRERILASQSEERVRLSIIEFPFFTVHHSHRPGFCQSWFSAWRVRTLTFHWHSSNYEIFSPNTFRTFDDKNLMRLFFPLNNSNHCVLCI